MAPRTSISEPIRPEKKRSVFVCSLMHAPLMKISGQYNPLQNSALHGRGQFCVILGRLPTLTCKFTSVLLRRILSTAILPGGRAEI